jgi:hypothetical protein
MKAVVLILTLALAFSWVAPATVSASSGGPVTGTSQLICDEMVSPNVIGIVTVIGAYALLWGAFAIALKVKQLVD